MDCSSEGTINAICLSFSGLKVLNIGRTKGYVNHVIFERDSRTRVEEEGNNDEAQGRCGTL